MLDAWLNSKVREGLGKKKILQYNNMKVIGGLPKHRFCGMTGTD